MKNKISIIFSVVFSMLACMVISFPSVASEVNPIGNYDRARVVVEGYEVTEGVVLPGQEFELKLTIKNISDRLTAQSTVLSIVNNQGIVFPEEGSSNQIVIGDIAANSTYEVMVPLRVNERVGDVENIIMMCYFNFLDVASVETVNETYISIPLNQESDPMIVQLSLADNSYATENVILSSAVENAGSVMAINMNLHVAVSGAEEFVYNLGDINGGLTKLYDHTIRMPKAGEQVVTAYLTYEDEDGNQFSSEPIDYKVRVLDGGNSMSHLQNSSRSEVNYISMLVNVFLVLVAVVIIVVFRKRDTRRITSGKEVGYGKRS